MRCSITSALNLSAQTFRVLLALKEVIRSKQGQHTAQMSDGETINEVVAYLARKRPDVDPYTPVIVEFELKQLVRHGLVRERNLQPTGCGNELVELTLANNDPRLERYRQWYSSEKQLTHEVPAGVAVAA